MMRETSDSRPSVHLSRYLTVGYVLLIVYASLSPFTGWREQGLEFSAVLTAPLWQTYTPFDAIVNLLAYIPLGLLFALATYSRFSAGGSVLLSTLAGILLSGTMEYIQMYLPVRTSSNLDLLTNSCGTLMGALLGMRIAPSGWFSLLAHWRQILIRSGDNVDFGLALVFLWMFAQINPSLPMLGNIFITEAARHPFPDMPAEPFGWLASMAVALNLLTLGCLLLTLLYQRRHAIIGLILVLFIVALGKFLAAALLLKSWALFLGLNSEAMLGVFTGLLLLVAATRLPSRLLSWCASFSVIAYLGLVHGTLKSGTPSGTMQLYHWREGHLLTYNVLSQYILALFPMLMLVYLWRIRRN
jgi:VanZ family protein